MKYLFIIGIMSPLLSRGFDFQNRLYNLPILGHVLMEKRIRHEVTDYFSDTRNTTEIAKAIKSYSLNNQNLTDGQLEDLIIKIFGKELGGLIIKISSMPDISKHLKNIATRWPELRDKEKCPEAFGAIVEAFVYIGVYSAITLYAPNPYMYLAGLGANVSVIIVHEVLLKTDTNKKVCDKINGDFEYAY